MVNVSTKHRNHVDAVVTVVVVVGVGMFVVLDAAVDVLVLVSGVVVAAGLL